MFIDGYNFLRKYRNYVNKKLIPSKIRMKRPGYLERVNVIAKALDEVNEFVSTKYDIGRDIYFDRDVLPNIYYRDEIVLLPKNTNTIFAYWEVKEETFNTLKKEHNVYDEVILRVYKEDKLFLTLQIPSRVGSTYINNVKSDSIYEISLGFINEKGEFFEVAKSNTAIAPSGKVSDNTSVTWGRGIRANSRVHLRRYSKYDLPDEEEFRAEILDEELEAFNIKEEARYIGSSNIRFGSSDLVRK